MIKDIMICAGVLVTGICHVQAAKKTEKPNIIFILCDDMGYGDLGCYGQKYIHTPNIDRMAQEGMRFTQAYAGSPVSAPSRATIMTGQHSGHTHVRGNKEYWKDVPMMKYGNNDEYTIVGQEPYDSNHIILPEIMKKNGYTTGMFGKWAGGYEGSYTNVEKLTFSLDGAGVENVTASNLSLVAYPNPAQDVINVQGWNKSEKAMLRIVNAAGQLCKTVADWNGDAIVVSDLAAGQYFIQINNQQTLKFVKL